MATKQPCRRCGHIKSLHYPPSAGTARRRYPCRLAGCKCKNYTAAPAKRK